MLRTSGAYYLLDDIYVAFPRNACRKTFLVALQVLVSIEGGCVKRDSLWGETQQR